ncbi:hypothetical protein B0H14DRAFT_3685182, partial [Mycena olivaceomarginata]
LKYYVNAGDFTLNNRHGEPGLHILYRAAACDAFYDSAERFPPPKCHPETRTKMLQDLLKWSSNANSHNVLWLHGPAGAGKSAIAQSFCQKLKEDGRLGASFFFKRLHPSRGTGNRLFPTIAYQLALHLPELKTAISQIVEDDPSSVNRALLTQLQKLIIKPCRQSICTGAFVIVIDGLDECENPNTQEEILRSIGIVIQDAPLPFRIFLASRPEPHIHDIFVGPLDQKYLSVNVNQASEEVRQFLVREFARIRREHRDTMAMVPHPWPSLNVIDNLVAKSSGYFIYASTVIKFVDDRNFRPPEQLDIIIGMSPPDSEAPFSALDQLYTEILSKVPRRSQLLRILTFITANLGLEVSKIERLLNLKSGDVQLTLCTRSQVSTTS